jgi:predicted RNase H-like HicB family nuclease
VKNNTFTFTAYITKEKNGFTALCRDVDVASEGPTLLETKENLTKAVSLYVESAIENNLPIIRPVPQESDMLQRNPEAVIQVFQVKIDLEIRAYA